MGAPNLKIAVDNANMNAAGVVRISDEEHLRRALNTDTPHHYIAERAGRMVFDGQDGIGYFNAETLHKRIISMVAKGKVELSKADLQKSLGTISFSGAIESYGLKRLPEKYVDAIGKEKIQARIKYQMLAQCR